MINWVFAIFVCLVLAGILMVASTSIPSGVVWTLLLFLAVVIGRGSVRRLTCRRGEDASRDA